MNKLGRGPLEDASYEISKLYDFQFQRTLFLCFKLVTQGRGQFGPQGHHLTLSQTSPGFYVSALQVS